MTSLHHWKHNIKKILDEGIFHRVKSYSEFDSRLKKLNPAYQLSAFKLFSLGYFAIKKFNQLDEIFLREELSDYAESLFLIDHENQYVDGLIEAESGKSIAFKIIYQDQDEILSLRQFPRFLKEGNFNNRIVFSNAYKVDGEVKQYPNLLTIGLNDLRKLKKSDFSRIHNYFIKKFQFDNKQTAKSPLSHQREAIEKIVTAFRKVDRAQIIMACGTGKTLVSLWTAEKQDVEHMLVLVPSLALLRQFLFAWVKECTWKNYDFIAVCSDQSMSKRFEDDLELNLDELEFVVTTEPQDVKCFLKGKSRRKIVFCTYQSVSVVADGMPRNFNFDLGVFDEAHKTAGKEGLFSFALLDKNIRIKKRLFMTATPRHFIPKEKNNDLDFEEAYSMDDEKLYGKVVYQLSFHKAVQLKLICDYQVLISVVTTKMLNHHLIINGSTKVEGDLVATQEVAYSLALKKAIEKYPITKIFSFHTTVEDAFNFTDTKRDDIHHYLKGFSPLHVNGKMTTTEREKILHHFSESQKAILSNARCLTEGIDLPAVDMSAFLCRKRSTIDIVQAAGRTMRKVTGKRVGYIFVPIFIQEKSGESIEEAVEKSDFAEAWYVINAMREQDSALDNYFKNISVDGKKLTLMEDSISSKIDIFSDDISFSLLKKFIEIRLFKPMRRRKKTWIYHYNKLLEYKKVNGHAFVPICYKDKELVHWISTQRCLFKKKLLARKEIDLLKKANFVFDALQSRWLENYEKLKKFKMKFKHTRVTRSYCDKKLAIWVTLQRSQYKNNKMSGEQIKLLNDIGFAFECRDNNWNKNFEELKKYKKNNGDCNLPSKSSALGRWLNNQRALMVKGKLNKYRRNALEDLGVVTIKSWGWDAKLEELEAFKKKHGHCNVPYRYIENRQLGNWVVLQRRNHKSGKLSKDRRSKLKKIGFDFSPKKEK